MTELLISPLARRIAEENNVNWRALEGSDAGGGVNERDVLNYLGGVMLGSQPVDPTPEPLPEGMTAWAEESARSSVQTQAKAAGNLADVTTPEAGTHTEPSTETDHPAENPEDTYRELFAELVVLKKAAEAVEEAREKERESAARRKRTPRRSENSVRLGKRSGTETPSLRNCALIRPTSRQASGLMNSGSGRCNSNSSTYAQPSIPKTKSSSKFIRLNSSLKRLNSSIGTRKRRSARGKACPSSSLKPTLRPDKHSPTPMG